MTFVGADEELLNIYHSLCKSAAVGYRVNGYYADQVMTSFGGKELRHINTLEYLLDHLEDKDKLELGDDMYVCMYVEAKKRCDWTYLEIL